jgi:hypothetical protein
MIAGYIYFVLIVFVLGAPQGGSQNMHYIKKILNYVHWFRFVSEPMLIKPRFIGETRNIRAMWPWLATMRDTNYVHRGRGINERKSYMFVGPNEHTILTLTTYVCQI